MSERNIRVNELILREVSHILRTRFRDQAVAVTITGVSISPDLRNGRIYYSVVGDERAKIKARSLFTKEYKTFQQLVSQKVVLKYFPKLKFMEDTSQERGSRILGILGELDNASAAVHPDDVAHDDIDGDGPEYVFDEDDLEYARDLASGADEEEDGENWDEEDDDDYEGDDDFADDEDESEPEDSKEHRNPSRRNQSDKDQGDGREGDDSTRGRRSSKPRR